MVTICKLRRFAHFDDYDKVVVKSCNDILFESQTVNQIPYIYTHYKLIYISLENRVIIFTIDTEYKSYKLNRLMKHELHSIISNSLCVNDGSPNDKDYPTRWITINADETIINIEYDNSEILDDDNMLCSHSKGNSMISLGNFIKLYYHNQNVNLIVMSSNDILFKDNNFTSMPTIYKEYIIDRITLQDNTVIIFVNTKKTDSKYKLFTSNELLSLFDDDIFVDDDSDGKTQYVSELIIYPTITEVGFRFYSDLTGKIELHNKITVKALLAHLSNTNLSIWITDDNQLHRYKWNNNNCTCISKHILASVIDEIGFCVTQMTLDCHYEEKYETLNEYFTYSDLLSVLNANVKLIHFNPINLNGCVDKIRMRPLNNEIHI